MSLAPSQTSWMRPHARPRRRKDPSPAVRAKTALEDGELVAATAMVCTANVTRLEFALIGTIEPLLGQTIVARRLAPIGEAYAGFAAREVMRSQ